MVEQWNRDGGTVEQIWWTGGTVIVGQWNGDGGTVDYLMVEQWNICWWNSRRSDDGTVEQSWWKSRTYVGVWVNLV